MKLARGFLILTGITFTCYGIYCLFNPMILNEYTGMGLTDTTALIEVRAMYGGLQFSMGLYLLLSGLQQARAAQGLLVAVFLFAGLAGARAYGLTVDDGDNGYNFAAAIYESLSGLIALALLQTSKKSS
jgi:hypothetical protein